MEGKADEMQPPYNAHFDANAQIKTIPKVSPMPSHLTIEPATSSAAALPVASAGNSVSDLLQLLVLQ